jgi:hypothetical protein
MNDNALQMMLFLLGVVVLFAIAIGLMRVENHRIYEKCLANNGTMVYNDAVQHCKEIVK